MSSRACCTGASRDASSWCRARSRAKNEIPAVLMRCLIGKHPMSDLFGAGGRRWLRGLGAAG
jgi:hypothetical protein